MGAPSTAGAARGGDPARGRRRDPEIDGKIRHAARVLYASHGWAGFHIRGVATAAGVSKDAVYRPYPDAQSLLLDALADQSLPALSSEQPIALVPVPLMAYAATSGTAVVASSEIVPATATPTATNAMTNFHNHLTDSRERVNAAFPLAVPQGTKRQFRII